MRLCFLGVMNQNASPTGGIFRLLLHAAAFLMAGLLLPFVWLREDQRFWTNAGGYPLWLRDLVLGTYYPLLLSYSALLAFLSWHLIRRPARFARWFYVEAMVLAVLWLVLAVVATMMLSNNIANLIDGRPLHDH